ncbi:MAG: SDR family oxidoreductase [Betaproteobacteria bacterium]|nr:SDR family oxidoreductase [Betaproteobacteria bacterium]
MSTTISLAGQVALVTGAATGIGAAIARTLAHAGATVVVNHLRRHAYADGVVRAIREAGGHATAFEADVKDAHAVADMVTWTEREFGRVDIAVQSAGVIQEKPFLETTEADWDFVVDTDLKGIFLCCRAVLPGMVRRGRGCVINIASELGLLGRASYAPYCAAKAGVIGITRALAREFAPAIRVNAIAPGPVDTPMLSVEHMSPEVLEAERAIPAERVGQPEEIAATALFLASDLASFYYGQVLGPNGGAHMG